MINNTPENLDEDIKVDSRPHLNGWAIGGYCCTCKKCDQKYMGDKRSTECADCAYKTEEDKAAALQDYLRFNLNSEIKVRLRKKGYERLMALHNEAFYRTNGAIKEVDIDFFKQRADEYGYTTMQAWCFIRDFGDVIYPGAEQYFDLNILIKSSSLENEGDLIRAKYEDRRE